MTDEIGYIIVFAICMAAIVMFMYLSYKERRELYSRLQAGTLQDFAVNQHRMESQKSKKVSAPLIGEGLPVVPEQQVFVELPASLASGGQQATRDLMGGE